MFKRSLWAICLLLAPAIVSGCGSAATTTTTTTTANGGTTGPTNQPASTSTATRPTTTAAPKGNTAPVEKAAEAGHQNTTRGPEHHAESAKPSSTKVTLQQVPRKRQYPKLQQAKFIATCTSAKYSTAACECLLVRFETSNVEKGQSLAEVLAIELGMQNRLPLPSRIRRQVNECRRA